MRIIIIFLLNVCHLQSFIPHPILNQVHRYSSLSMPQIQAQVIISDYKHLLMAGFGNTANAPTKKGKKRDKGKDGLKDGLKDRGKDAGSR